MALGSDLLWVHPKDNTDSRDPFNNVNEIEEKTQSVALCMNPYKLFKTSNMEMSLC